MAIMSIKAQVTVTTPAHAKIVVPITLTLDNSGLEFGDLAVSSTLGGLVTLTPADPTVVTNTSGVTLMTTGASRVAAKFTVGGVAGYAYSISPISNTVVTSGTNSMTVSAITALTNSNSSATSGTLISGSDIFYVGGTLVVTMGQAPGIYRFLSGHC